MHRKNYKDSQEIIEVVGFLIKLKRVYDPAVGDDCFRILVDRLWPRGMSKERAKLDFWLKEIAPSDELRMWFSHESEKWEEFQNKYRKELSTKEDLLKQLKQFEKEKNVVTLVYAARDTEHNNAVVLKSLLEK